MNAEQLIKTLDWLVNKMCKLCPGRSQNEIRSRYNVLQEKDKRQFDKLMMYSKACKLRLSRMGITYHN